MSHQQVAITQEEQRPLTSAALGYAAPTAAYTEPGALSLHELLRLCLCSRDELLWTEFIRHSQPVIAGVVMKAVRRWTGPRPPLVDDLMQDTYLKLFDENAKALRRFVGHHEMALYGFLKVVAANTVHDHVRGSLRKKRGSGLPEIDIDNQIIVDELKRPSEDMERGLLLQTIDRCLNTATATPTLARDRMIFWLYYGQGLTASDISRLPGIGIGVKGVESVLVRMVRLVRLKVTELPASRRRCEHDGLIV